jgi:hypothetical protein
VILNPRTLAVLYAPESASGDNRTSRRYDGGYDPPQGQADLRAIDRETARRILHCLDRFIKNREGDIKNLKPPRTDYRLHCDDYRLFFDFAVYETRAGRIRIITMTIRITAVLHRRAAYR